MERPHWGSIAVGVTLSPHGPRVTLNLEGHELLISATGAEMLGRALTRAAWQCHATLLAGAALADHAEHVTDAMVRDVLNAVADMTIPLDSDGSAEGGEVGLIGEDRGLPL